MNLQSALIQGCVESSGMLSLVHMRALNGKNHWLCYVFPGLNCQHMSRVLQCCHNEV